ARADMSPDTTKTIFILDEYEQLFGQLRGAARNDEYLEYTVAHPLFDQIASFARHNLVVFLGQEPDAHFVLMVHNQVSPVLRQEHFPVFEHKPESDQSEFYQFLRRVLSEHVTCEPRFVDAVFGETSGHPYLTVNMMVEMFDWLTARRRRVHEVL